MKRNLSLLKFGVFALCVLVVSSAVMGQSQSSQAMTWFKVGLTENDPQKKIAAYLKALEFDPQFVEAYYNVGVAFKKQQDYQRAEQYLHKALAAKPEKIKNATKLQILFELATTYKKLGKIDNAEEAFGGAKGIAMDPPMKSAIALELGRLLYDKGQYQAALVELREGRNNAGANQEQFNNLLVLVENEVEWQRLYDAAEKAKSDGNRRGAKALYEQIRAKRPEYKDTAAKIAELDTQLNAETQKNALAALYDQAVKQAAEGNLDLAIVSFENVLQQSGGNYKDAKTRLETARQQFALKQQNEKLENDYMTGLAALKARNWPTAILAFENVINRDRNYRDARKRLAESKSGLERESKETIVARYYADGVTAMNKNDLGGARAAFEKVRQLNANYRDVAALLAEVENALQQKSAPVTNSAPAARVNIDSLYQEAGAAAKRQDWMQAVINFEKVQLLRANYRDVVDQLAQARVNATLAAKPETKAESKLPFYLGSLVALVALPLLGLAAFSPAIRARLHLMRGDYMAAAQIYEQILMRYPDKVKLYPVLANIYLLQGRHDENALRVFKTVLQLNLATTNREEINAIVAQRYLTEGRTDSDAIEVLESALKAEQRRAKN